MGINKVKEYIIGGYFKYEDEIYRITSFPTRNSICGENVEIGVGIPSNIKTSIKDITHVPTEEVHKLLNDIQDIDDSLFFDKDGNLKLDIDEIFTFEDEE